MVASANPSLSGLRFSYICGDLGVIAGATVRPTNAYQIFSLNRHSIVISILRDGLAKRLPQGPILLLALAVLAIGEPIAEMKPRLTFNESNGHGAQHGNAT